MARSIFNNAIGDSLPDSVTVVPGEDVGGPTLTLEGTRSHVQMYAETGDAYWELKATQDDGPVALAYGEAAINADGSAEYSTVAVQSVFGGSVALSADASSGVWVNISGDAGQTGSLLIVRTHDGEYLFSVDATSPIVYSPNGTGYRLKVANNGTLSTEEVV